MSSSKAGKLGDVVRVIIAEPDKAEIPPGEEEE